MGQLKPQRKPTIFGEWNNGEIKGTHVSWIDRKKGTPTFMDMQQISSTELKMDVGEGHMIIGKVEDDGKLHWSCEPGETEIQCDQLDAPWERKEDNTNDGEEEEEEVEVVEVEE